MSAAFDPALYAIIDRALDVPAPAAERIAAAVAGGVTLIQLRGKRLPARALLLEARDLVRTLRPLGIPLIVNDRPDVARAAGAQGVHLGQDDLPASVARRFWPDGLIGVSVHDGEELRMACAAGADYVAAGALFATATKDDAAPLDHALFRRLADASPLPLVGIGGIGPAEAGVVAGLGAAGVAVIRGLWSADDVGERARSYRAAFAQRMRRNL